MVAPKIKSPAPAPAPPPSAVDELTAYLDGDYAALKTQVRAVLARPEFAHHYDLDRTRHRELIWERVQELARRGWGGEIFPDAAGRSDVPKFFAIFETLGSSDPNLVIKFGLQFGLFGGAIFYLGTQRHHDEYLPLVASTKLVGCYAMTEIGHGSDTHRLQTVARYDRATGEFVIDSTEPGARKQFIGNAAMHATTAVVFAQLEIDGARHGVFGFLVPIRNPNGTPRPGVRIGDTGQKIGLHGIDNGWLWFERVRIPRENLLDRFGAVTAAGAFESRGGNPTVLAQRAMSGGRAAIGLGALSSAKSGLAIAIRYAARRRQFGKEERLILDYPLHQRRLLPRLATVYALDAAFKRASAWARDTQNMTDPDFEELTALLKAYSTWYAIETLQECREACGGQGYLAVNRIGVLRADVDPMTTLEGDNSLLYMFVARQELGRFRDKFLAGGRLAPLWHLQRMLTERAAAMLAVRTGAGERLRDPACLLRLLRYREHAVTWDAARRLQSRASREPGADYQSPLLELAQAQVERISLEEFGKRIERAPAGVRVILGLLRDLYALSCIARHAGWYLRERILTSGDARRADELVALLCHEVRPHAVTLVDGFAIPDACLGDLNAQREAVLPPPLPAIPD